MKLQSNKKNKQQQSRSAFRLWVIAVSVFFLAAVVAMLVLLLNH
jgi:hypothetical protein